MEEFEFYAVVGYNGVAVMNSLKRALKLKKYICNADIKGFENFHEAEQWALDKFNDNIDPRCQFTMHYLKVNRAMFQKDILYKNR